MLASAVTTLSLLPGEVRDVSSLHHSLSTLPRGQHGWAQPSAAKLTSLLAKCLTKQWKLFEETPMRSTELQLLSVSVECMVAAERLPQGHQGDPVSVENLQPDMVLVSQSLKRIGLLDLSGCRPSDSLS